MKKYSGLIILFTATSLLHQFTSLYLFWRHHWDFDFFLASPANLGTKSLETIHEVTIPHLLGQMTFNFILAHFLLIQVKEIKYGATFSLGLLISCLVNIYSSYLAFITQSSLVKPISFFIYQFFLIGCLVLIFKSLKSSQLNSTTE